MSDNIENIEAIRKRISSLQNVDNCEKTQIIKNLSIALALEFGNLIEASLWLQTDDANTLESNNDRYQPRRGELANVFWYIYRLCRNFGLKNLEENENVPCTTIFFDETQHFWLSNFSSFAIEWRGRLWATAEHAYQAAKFMYGRDEISEKIRNCRSAYDAKALAHSYTDIDCPDSEESFKLGNLEDILWFKIKQHKYIQDKLFETGNCELIYKSNSDTYWGIGENLNGANMFGKLWMRLRDELKLRKG